MSGSAKWKSNEQPNALAPRRSAWIESLMTYWAHGRGGHQLATGSCARCAKCRAGLPDSVGLLPPQTLVYVSPAAAARVLIFSGVIVVGVVPPVERWTSARLA